MDPYLKWVGCKARMSERLASRVPRSYGRYFETNLGSAALYLHMQPDDAWLSDALGELMACHRAVRDDPEGVIRELALHRNSREHFNKTRALPAAGRGTPAWHAARTIYLNRTCYRGLFRQNKQGKFNTPWGAYSKPTICNVRLLRQVSNSFSRPGVRLLTGDMSYVERFAIRYDFVYIDPPYDETYSAYTGEPFGREQQVATARLFDRLTELGVYVMLSNSDTSLTRDLYKKHRVERIWRSGSFSSAAARRPHVPELLVRNY